MTAHPDIDLLSALVDGIDEDGTAEHVRTCASCARQLDALRAASATIAAPDPSAVLPGLDAAVAAAMAAVDDPAPASVVPLAARRRRPLPRWPLAAAAVILVVALAVPLLSSLGGQRSHKASTVAGPSVSTSDRDATAAQGQTSAGDQAAPLDLGAIDDDATLRARLSAGALDGVATAGGDAKSFSTAATGAATPAAPTAGPETTAPPAPSPSSCERAAVVAAGLPGATVQTTARLVWQRRPAVVFVIPRPDGSRVAVVVARDDCATLQVVTL